MNHVDPGSRMLEEMSSQPQVLRDLLDRRASIGRLVADILPDPLRGIVLVARGSSDNAAIHGRYVLEMAAGVPVSLAAPSLQTRYGVTPQLDGFLAIGISQSGATPEIVGTLERLGAGGARVLALTNQEDSDLAALAEATILLGAGHERAIPATKTFTAQVAALCLVATAVGSLPDLAGDVHAGWEASIDAVEAVLENWTGLEAAAAAIVGSSHVVTVARGLLYAAALETALKLAETTGRSVQGLSTADLQHGPIAAVGEGSLALCLAGRGPTEADLIDVAAQLTERGATVLAMGSEDRVVPTAAARIDVPGAASPSLEILPTVVRGQQLAYLAALRLGIDPDAPFALNKVTPTD